VRIPNLILLGWIAGAILFIPTEVFAEQDQAEKRNSAAEQKSNSNLKQEKAKENIPVQAERKENVSKPEVSEANLKKAKDNTALSKGSEKKAKTRKTNIAAEKARSSQKTKYSNGVKNSVPRGQLKKNVPIRQPGKKKAETSKYIITETPINKSVLPEETAEDVQKKKLFLSKKDVQDQRGKAVSKLPIELPSNELPKQPASKAIPLTAGQSSSHSSSGKDAGNGAPSLASFKASLILPLIFAESEKVSVYFSRMDLLRSQWVNAPPSMPPETAL
jgi:hypothetical protein